MRALTSVKDLDLSVNALGQRWTHTHTRTCTHTHTHKPLVYLSAVKGSHLGLNSYENVLVLCFQDVSAITRTKHTYIGRY